MSSTRPIRSQRSRAPSPPPWLTSLTKRPTIWMWPVLPASLRPTSPWLPWRAAPRSSFLTGRRRTMKPQVEPRLRLHPKAPPPVPSLWLVSSHAVKNVAAHLLPSFRVRNCLHHQRRKRGGAVCGDHQSDAHGCGEPQTREQVCLRRSCTFILTPYTLFMCKHSVQSFHVNVKSQISEIMLVLPSLWLS